MREPLKAAEGTVVPQEGNASEVTESTWGASAHEVQLDLGDAGCDVGTALLLNRDRLQLDRAEGADQNVGADTSSVMPLHTSTRGRRQREDRYGHSGATMILLAFWHGLRGCSGQSI